MMLSFRIEFLLFLSLLIYFFSLMMTAMATTSDILANIDAFLFALKYAHNFLQLIQIDFQIHFIIPLHDVVDCAF